MSDGQTPTPPPEPKSEVPRAVNKQVILAAILGGILGAVFSFVLARTFPTPVKPTPTPPPSEARQFANELLQLLKNGDKTVFMKRIRSAFSGLTDEQFAEFCQKSVFENRDQFAKVNGPSIEFEFARESVLSPSLVRVAYTEKYAHKCMLWVMVLYNAPDGWQVSAFSFDSESTGFRALQ